MAGGDIVTSSAKAMENTDHYIHMRDSGHVDFITKARRCELFVDAYPNNQWDPAVLAKLAAEGRPAMSINKIFPAMAAMMGEQLQNQVDIAFRPTASGNEETAKALDVAWLHVANTNTLDWTRSEVFDSGAITGRGFYDMRMSFNDNLRGDIRIKKLDYRNAMIDPDASSYDPDDWNKCIITKWFTPDQIAAHYDTAKAKELEMRAGDDYAHGFGYDLMDVPMTRFGKTLGYGTAAFDKRQKFIRVIERQHKELLWREHFVDRITGETRPIPTTAAWDRNRIANVLANLPDLDVLRLQTFAIRWTVSAFDLLLFDAISPYKHFTMVPYFPMLIGGNTMGLVENQIGPQEVLNKTSSQELHVVNTTANSGWILQDGNLLNMDTYELEQKGAQTGLVLEVRDINGITKIQPNQVPTGLDRVSHNARNDLFEISLVNKSQLGIDREDVSGKAMERKQLRGPVNMGKPLANLVRTEHMLARNAVDLVQAFWTEERALRVTRKLRGRDEDVELTINQMTPEGNLVNDVTLGEYSVMTSTVSLREQQEDSEFDQLAALRENGVDIADEELVALSRARNKKEILERMSSSAEARAKDMEVERALKQAELETAQTEVQVRKTDALEKTARAQRSGEETKMLQLEKQVEMARVATELQKARNDAERLDIEREKMRRDFRLEAAKLRAVNSKPVPVKKAS